MSESPAEVLQRWITAGGGWQVLHEGADAMTVGLLTCTGGEQVDQVHARGSELPALRDVLDAAQAGG